MKVKTLRFAKNRGWVYLMALVTAATAMCILRSQAQPDTTSILHLSECQLPCWIGIVPGETTIAEAEKLIRASYDSERVDVITTEPYPSCSFGRRFSILYESKIGSLFVGLNRDSAPQSDKTIVQDLYLSVNSSDASFIPKVIDFMSILGRPRCLAVQWGNHTAYPSMLYPQFHVKLLFGSERFEVAPHLPANLSIYGQPNSCGQSSVAWRGFNYDYRRQFIKSMQP